MYNTRSDLRPGTFSCLPMIALTSSPSLPLLFFHPTSRTTSSHMSNYPLPNLPYPRQMPTTDIKSIPV